MNLSTTASAIGLYAFEHGHPDSSVYSLFYSKVLEQLALLRISPTYIGVNGRGYPDKFTKIGGAVNKRLLSNNFAGIRSCSIVSGPRESGAPAFDGVFHASIGYSPSRTEVQLCLDLNASLAGLFSIEFDRLLMTLITLVPWQYGFGLSAPAATEPGLYVLGMGRDGMTRQQEQSLNAWYSADSASRCTRLRSIYPYNLVNEHQLRNHLKGGGTLSDYISRQHAIRVRNVTDSNLTLWTIPDEAELIRITGELKVQGVLIE